MKRRKSITLLFVLTLTIASCGIALGKDDSLFEKLTPQNPVVVNKAEGTISFLAEVNGKYFFNGTRHASVFIGGKFGDKAVFRSFLMPKSFHDALVEIGAKPGENMTLENKEKTNVQGDLLEVTVTWKGANRSYSLDEVVKDTNGKPIVMRFGGNMPMSLSKDTGCLICLDSCPVSICSNAAYTYGAVESRSEVSFTGNKEILPPDGAQVVITFKKKG